MDGKFFVSCANVIDFPCDVIVLKYAQNFYGADATVAELLTNQLAEIRPLPGKCEIILTQGKIAATYALFVGVVDLYKFDYAQIRQFAEYSLSVLAKELPQVKHIAMTMHGVGYGLDEREAFLAQLAGLFDALRDNSAPRFLERITIVERNQARATRLNKIFEEYLPSSLSMDTSMSLAQQVLPKSRINAGSKSNTKPHIFVAMPFSEDMEDVFTFGIQGPVNKAGFLCERIDLTSFTGDILSRIKSRIESASLVVADLTGANANVYLEVGYAWGRERQTLLLVKKGEDLKFDVRSQRCLHYKNISDLAKQLENELGTFSEYVQGQPGSLG
jgi:hypothetical protein